MDKAKRKCTYTPITFKAEGTQGDRGTSEYISKEARQVGTFIRIRRIGIQWKYVINDPERSRLDWGDDYQDMIMDHVCEAVRINMI